MPLIPTFWPTFTLTKYYLGHRTLTLASTSAFTASGAGAWTTGFAGTFHGEGRRAVLKGNGKVAWNFGYFELEDLQLGFGIFLFTFDS